MHSNETSDDQRSSTLHRSKQLLIVVTGLAPNSFTSLIFTWPVWFARLYQVEKDGVRFLSENSGSMDQLHLRREVCSPAVTKSSRRTCSYHFILSSWSSSLWISWRECLHLLRDRGGGRAAILWRILHYMFGLVILQVIFLSSLIFVSSFLSSCLNHRQK